MRGMATFEQNKTAATAAAPLRQVDQHKHGGSVDAGQGSSM
jgi:hypothetical protein